MENNKTFEEQLQTLSENNWKVRKLLEEFGSYDDLPENVNRLIDKQINK